MTYDERGGPQNLCQLFSKEYLLTVPMSMVSCVYKEKMMKPFTWMVWKRNRLVGYVVAYSEWDAYKIAAKEYGSEFYLERPWVEQRKTVVSA